MQGAATEWRTSGNRKVRGDGSAHFAGIERVKLLCKKTHRDQN